MPRPSPIKAIRAKCIECMGGSYQAVDECTSSTCPLFEYRSGENPHRQKRTLTDEQRLKRAETLEIARQAKKTKNPQLEGPQSADVPDTD